MLEFLGPLLIGIALVVVILFPITKAIKLIREQRKLRNVQLQYEFERRIIDPINETVAEMFNVLSKEVKDSISAGIRDHEDYCHSTSTVKSIESKPILTLSHSKENTKEDECVPSYKPLKILTPKFIHQELDKTIIGQEVAKKALSIAISNHAKRVNYNNTMSGNYIKKSNVLLVGPTGSGKTLLAQKIADILEVPFVAADCTQYTSSGWAGRDLTDIFTTLLERAGSVEKAERGIVFLDEIDKVILQKGDTHHGFNIQRDLLSIIEGSVPVKLKFSELNTRDILFICGGAFVGLKEQVQSKDLISSIGFNATVHTENSKKKLKFDHVDSSDLVAYGMMEEFVGRVPTLVVLEELTNKELVRVLTEPTDAIITEYINLLAFDQVQLLFEPPALRAIARYAKEKGTGARGLRAVLDRVMSETMYKVPSDLRIYKVVITKSIVERALR